jgi:hypothetical protein
MISVLIDQFIRRFLKDTLLFLPRKKSSSYDVFYKVIKVMNKLDNIRDFS